GRGQRDRGRGAGERVTPILIAVIAVALLFDYTNGFHDAANAVATSISTRAIPPNVALAAAALLNIVGALVSTHVAATLASGIVDAKAVNAPVLLGGLAGAIVWNLLTWWWALPNSSSHCLIGGMAGAVYDTQKTMGVITLALFSGHVIPSLTVPLWVKLASAVTIGAGTYAGGKKIIR